MAKWYGRFEITKRADVIGQFFLLRSQQRRIGAFLGRGRRPFFSVLDPTAKGDSYIELQVVSKEKNTEITFSRLKSMQIYIIK